MSIATTAFAIQRQLFPMLEEEIGPLSDTEQRFVRVVELAHPERFMSPFQWAFIGRKPEDRLPIAKAFIAKVVWNFTTTRALLGQPAEAVLFPLRPTPNHGIVVRTIKRSYALRSPD